MTAAQTKAKELVDMFSKIRFDILTKMDSIPCIISDYPTTLTAKICAMKVADEVLESHFYKKTSGYKTFWLNVRKEIENITDV